MKLARIDNGKEVEIDIDLTDTARLRLMQSVGVVSIDGVDIRQLIRESQPRIATLTLGGKKVPFDRHNTIFAVQIGKGKGSYHTVAKGLADSGVFIQYEGINVHSGYKKRLVMNEKVIHRVITA